MANRQHEAWLLEGVPAWNQRRQDTPFTPDLSGTDIHDLFANAGKLNGSGNVELFNVDFSSALLPEASFRHARLILANFKGANLMRARFEESDLSGANFTDAILRNATVVNTNFMAAILKNASLQHAKVQGSSFTYTDLHGANLANVKLWEAELYDRFQPTPAQQTKQIIICSVQDLLREIQQIKGDYDTAVSFYYRGQSNDSWELRPSLMRSGVRDNLLPHESEMLQELITRRPEDFAGTSSALGQWVLARHHGLKTRFLDILRNPLVGLFFASSDSGAQEASSDGCLLVFAVPRSLVKPYNSDTVSVIANFAKLSHANQQVLLGQSNEFLATSYLDVMGRLCQLIQAEKPYFLERINPKDFYRICVVEPQQSIERIRVQTGAFLMSIFHERFETTEVLKWNPDIPIYTSYELTVPNRCKADIRKELESLNITSETLFPGLETAAEAITEAYRGGTSRS